MKKLGTFLLLLSVTMFTFGCSEDTGTDADAADGAAADSGDGGSGDAGDADAAGDAADDAAE